MPGAVAALLGERKAWDGVWLFPATAAADDDEGDGAPRPNAHPKAYLRLGLFRGGVLRRRARHRPASISGPGRPMPTDAPQ